MTTAPRFLPASLAFLASSAALLFAGAANAGQSCAADAECPNGFSCQVVGGSSCAGYACPDGANCPPPPPCEPVEFRECRPGPCATDADCATGMVCFTQTQVDCPPSAGGGAYCPPGAECPVPAPAPEPTPCTTTTQRSCVPRYMLPCTVDINCGDGFTCVPDSCDCAVNGGGTGVGGTSGGTPPSYAGTAGAGTEPTPAGGSAGMPSAGAPGIDPTPYPYPSCTCPAPTSAHCEPRQIVCTTAANCPSQWSCVATRTASGGGACGAPAPTPENPNPVPECTPLPPPPPSPNYCMPPYYDLGYGSASDSGGGIFGSAGTSGAGATTGAGIPPTSPNGTGGSTSGDHNARAAGSAESNDSGGCQMSASHTGSSASALLALFGFIGLARRKRARASV